MVKANGTLTGTNNLIDDAAAGTGFSDGLNGNIINHPALLGSLGTYGSANGIQTFPLLPGSPSIDAGDDTTCNTSGAGKVNSLDQRGITRPKGAHCDIGAFESQGFTLTRTSGDGQSTGITLAFATPLVVTVASTHGEPVDGGSVTFTAPVTNASLQPATSSVMIGVTTTGQARLNAIANSSVGGPYPVTASATGTTPSSVSFALTNLSASLNGISPASGGTTGGNMVTLIGIGFGNASNTTVLLDGVALPAASVTSVTGTTITYTAPVHVAANVTVTVKVSGATLSGSVTYTYGEAVTLPGSKPTGGPNGSPVALPGSRPQGNPSGNPNPVPAPRP